MNDDARATIAHHWKAAMASSSMSGFPVEIENLRFNRPKNAAWGRYTLLCGESNPMAVNSRDARSTFSLVIQVFIPGGEGTSIAYKLADAMSVLNCRQYPGLEGKSVVTFYTAYVSKAVDEDGFSGFNVTISGYCDTQSQP